MGGYWHTDKCKRIVWKNPGGPGGGGAPWGEPRGSEGVCMYVYKLHVRHTAWLLPSIPVETVVGQSKDYGLWNGVDLGSKLALALNNYVTCAPGACLSLAEEIIPVFWVKMAHGGACQRVVVSFLCTRNYSNFTVEAWWFAQPTTPVNTETWPLTSLTVWVGQYFYYVLECNLYEGYS